ncbi:MAG: fructosamine kinase family protein [Saprospiraceae bacterium]|nr:fructosamine kinase family protein [Saprospiraceae bacterium]
MDPSVRPDIERFLGTRIASLTPVAGGDINAAYRVSTVDGHHYFLKYHSGDQGHAMLMAEKAGLAAIRSTGRIGTPAIIAGSGCDKYGWLLLEFLPTKPPDRKDWSALGRQLANLHRVTDASFGFETDNFIGTLPQSNRRHDNWPAFYAQERLMPQIRMARSWFSGEAWTRVEQLVARIPDLVDPGVPALIHGDLWGGNFLITAEGPVLIDPAVCFAHREMDIAMSRLFGGFDPRFYEAYEDAWPLADGWEERLGLYQLYYLLAHLNMFGASYLGSVTRIIQTYV